MKAKSQDKKAEKPREQKRQASSRKEKKRSSNADTTEMVRQESRHK